MELEGVVRLNLGEQSSAALSIGLEELLHTLFELAISEGARREICSPQSVQGWVVQ